MGKPTRNIVTPAERERIVSLYELGLPVAEVIARAGCSASTVYSSLQRAGVDLRQEGRRGNASRCEECGAPVRYVTPAQQEAGLGRFCSSKCMGLARTRAAGIVPEPAELRCHRCNNIKPVEGSYPHTPVKRRYQYWCKDCCRIVRKEREGSGRSPSQAAACPLVDVQNYS